MANIGSARLKIEVSITFPDGTMVTEKRHDADYDGLMLALSQLCASTVREVKRMNSQEHWEFLWQPKRG